MKPVEIILCSHPSAERSFFAGKNLYLATENGG